MSGFYSGLPEEFWSGKPINYREGSPAVRAWFDRQSVSSDIEPYFKEKYDLRARFSKDKIVVREYIYNGPNGLVPDNEIYITYLYTGNFNYRQGAFVDGVLTGCYLAYREKGYGKGKIYPHGTVSSYQVSGLSFNRQNFGSIDSDPGIKTISFSQGDGGSRFVNIGQTRNVEPYVRYSSLQELQAGMRAEGIPEVFIDPYFGYLSDPFLKFDFPTISSSGGGGTVSDQLVVQVTTTSADNLVGNQNQKDQFQFILDPLNESAPDRIVNFNAKEGDTIQISKSVFGIASGRFAVAKKPKSLNKLLSSDVDIIYNKKSGQLILNANGAQPGFGDDGGVFALLAGNPTLNNSSVSFI